MQSVKEQYTEEKEKRQEAINKISELWIKMGKKKDYSNPHFHHMMTAIRSYKIHDGRMQRLEKWYPEEVAGERVFRESETPIVRLLEY